MKTGDLIGERFRLQHLLGEGGMAEVWLAQDDRLQREVAVKLLRPQYGRDPALLERFRREATLVAQLDSPHIVAVYGVDAESEPGYIVMEYVDGQDLKEHLRWNAPLPVEEALRLLRDIAQGVAAAHEAGLVHRDLKPGNVLLSTDGAVKITDFGIARETARAGLTEPGKVWGTSHYLAPEQAAGQSISPATDVYSLGVLLFEMLTGRVPFPGEDPVAVALAHIRQSPPDVQSVNPGVPAGVARLIRRMMDKVPARRPSDAGVLVDILNSYLRQTTSATSLQNTVPPAEQDTGVQPAAPPVEERVGGETLPPPPARRRLREPRPATPMRLPLLLGGGLLLLAALFWGGRTLLGGEQATANAPTPAPVAASEVSATPPLPTFTPALSSTPAPTSAVTEISVLDATTTPAPTPSATALPPPGPLRQGNGPDALARALGPGESIIVDGNLNEWVGEAVVLARPVLGAERWQSPDDLSGEARFAWDDRFLYLAVTRTDEQHYQPQGETDYTGYELYRGDAVELWLDSNLAGDFGVAAANEGLQDDFQLAFSAGDLQTSRAEGVVYWPDRRPEWNQQLQVRSEALPNGYTLEAAIPWALLDVTPRPNLVLGYVVVLNDNDEPFSNEPQTQVASNREPPYLKPLTFGNLILQP